MAGASEFAVGNPQAVAYKGYTAATNTGGVALKDYDSDLRRCFFYCALTEKLTWLGDA